MGFCFGNNGLPSRLIRDVLRQKDRALANILAPIIIRALKIGPHDLGTLSGKQACRSATDSRCGPGNDCYFPVQPRHYVAASPPSTARDDPVTYVESSLAKNRIAAATSSGSPYRRIGTCGASDPSLDGSPVIGANIGV